MLCPKHFFFKLGQCHWWQAHLIFMFKDKYKSTQVGKVYVFFMWQVVAVPPWMP